MHSNHEARPLRTPTPLWRLLPKVMRFVVASALFPSLAWGQTTDEMKQMLQQLIEQNKALQERVEKLERDLATPPPTASSAAPRAPAAAPPTATADAKPPEPPPTTGARLTELEGLVKDLKLLPFVKDWEWSGYVDATYGYNFNNAQSQANRLRVFDEKSNTFRFNSAELNVGKPSTAQSPWGFGLTFNLGTDAEKIHSTGLGLSSPDNPFDIQQAFLTYKWNVGNGLDFKLGKFVTLHGQEVIESPSNFNISRSFLFGFAIPFTHTGLMVSYPIVPDLLTASVGVVNGWDNVDDNNDGKSVHWQFALTPMKNLSVALTGIYGAEQNGTSSPKRSVEDLVISYKPIEPLTLALNADLGHEQRVPLVGLTKDAYWYGVAAYASYDFTDRLTLSLRGEYFVDEDGARTGLSAVNQATGLSDRLNLWEATATLKYKLTEKLYGRLEYRHDQTVGRVNTAFDKRSFIFNRGQQDTVGVELYYQF